MPAAMCLPKTHLNLTGDLEIKILIDILLLFRDSRLITVGSHHGKWCGKWCMCVKSRVDEAGEEKTWSSGRDERMWDQ